MRFEARSKLSQMKRSLARLERIYCDTGSVIATSDARDAIEDFVNHAHHFKDYLKREHPRSAERIEKLVTSDRSLALIADLSNSFKHAHDIAKRRKKHAEESGGSDIGDLLRINSHTTVELGPGLSKCSQRLEISFRGARFDALELAHAAVASWDLLLEEEGISPHG